MSVDFKKLHANEWVQEIRARHEGALVEVKVKTTDGSQVLYLVATHPTVRAEAVLSNGNGEQKK